MFNQPSSLIKKGTALSSAFEKQLYFRENRFPHEMQKIFEDFMRENARVSSKTYLGIQTAYVIPSNGCSEQFIVESGRYLRRI